jgi:hypothetical protein
MNSKPNHNDNRVWAVALAVALVAGPISQVWAGNPVPPPVTPYGMSYEEWSAKWWQWALSMPNDQNPFFDEGGNCDNGANGQLGPVWFLTGVINTSGTAVRNCTVPAGKALFFPIINVECSTLEPPPYYGGNEQELIACVHADDFAFGEVFAEIDGKAVKRLDRYLVQSPMFNITVPRDNVLGVDVTEDPGGFGQSVSNGYYLMLPPLRPGKHIVHFGGTYTGFDFSLDITYNLTVARPRKGR